MVKKVIWSSRAKSDLKEILQYWIKRNKSISYSLKLNALIEEQLDLIAKFPTIGRKTDIANVYVKIIVASGLMFFLTRNLLLPFSNDFYFQNGHQYYISFRRLH